jgi:hypothetical protein
MRNREQECLKDFGMGLGALPSVCLEHCYVPVERSRKATLMEHQALEDVSLTNV